MSEPLFVVNLDPRTHDLRDQPFDPSALEAFAARRLTDRPTDRSAESSGRTLVDAPWIRLDLAPDTATFAVTPGPAEAAVVHDVLSTVGGTALGAGIGVNITCDRAWLGADRGPTDTALIVVRSEAEVAECLVLDGVHPGIYDGPRAAVRTLPTFGSEAHVARALGDRVSITLDDEGVLLTGVWFDPPMRLRDDGTLVDEAPPATITMRWGAATTVLDVGLRYAARGWTLQAAASHLRVWGHGANLMVTGPRQAVLSEPD
ncbi:hypothetical protein ACWDPV_22160 [Gordonia sp. NPDC003504]